MQVQSVSPNLIVDGIELLLQHESQGLGVSVAGGRECIHVGKLIVSQVCVITHIKRMLHVSYNMRLLQLLPVLLVQRVHLPHTTRTRLHMLLIDKSVTLYTNNSLTNASAVY